MDSMFTNSVIPQTAACPQVLCHRLFLPFQCCFSFLFSFPAFPSNCSSSAFHNRFFCYNFLFNAKCLRFSSSFLFLFLSNAHVLFCHRRFFFFFFFFNFLSISSQCNLFWLSTTFYCPVLFNADFLLTLVTAPSSFSAIIFTLHHDFFPVKLCILLLSIIIVLFFDHCFLFCKMKLFGSFCLLNTNYLI